jgi:DNA-binding GntR family transcriptional regulator
MHRVISQHWAIIEAMRGSDNDLLARLIREHMPGSPEEYIRNYEIRHGSRS